MKKTIKIFSLLFVIACIYSCSPNQDLGFEPTPESGWIQFVDDDNDPIFSNQTDQELISIGVNIQVPTTSSDLRINYNLVSVSGLDPNAAFSNNGYIISPAGQTSYMGPDNNTGLDYVFLPTIDFDISQIAASLTEHMVFDVVLAGTNGPGITAGLAGEDKPITQRITILCPSHDAASSTAGFLGDYNLTTSTLSAFGVPIFDDQVVTLTEGTDGPYSRQFDVASYLPAFGGPGITLDFEFEDGDYAVGFTRVPFGCASAIWVGPDNSAILPAPCDDATINLNYLDFIQGTGGCGVEDLPFQVTLTKI